MEAETHFENIQGTIITNLHKANQNIRIAVAWFTDKEIIKQLEEISLRGVIVEIIVADNELNRSVDYSSLTNNGVKLLFFPVRGYGMMHHKFCVIDDILVINGSYNWTVNARSNNGENIQIAKDANTISQFLKKFEDLKHQALGLPIKAEGIKIEKPKSEIEKKTTEIEEDFEEEWNIYLNSKVSNYDREDLQKQGKTAAANTHGNSEVIPNKMSMIYQTIVEDTEVDKNEIQKLKVRLESKIDNYQAIHKQEAEEKKLLLN